MARVDGRAAAHAFAGAGEEDRALTIDGAAYRVTRAADGSFNLFSDEPAAAISTATPADRGASLMNARAVMWAIVGLLALTPLIWFVTATRYTRTSRHRVEQILAGMATEPDPATIGLWARDTHHLADMRELSSASDKFDDWRREKDMLKPIGSWSVVSVRKVAAERPTVVVRVMIDGRKLAMLVPERLPISWAAEED